MKVLHSAELDFAGDFTGSFAGTCAEVRAAAKAKADVGAERRMRVIRHGRKTEMRARIYGEQFRPSEKRYADRWYGE